MKINEFLGFDIFDDEPIEAPEWLNPKLKKYWEQIKPVDAGVVGARLKTQLKRLNQMAKSDLIDMANKLALEELQRYYKAVKENNESMNEDATPGATVSGNIASVANPEAAYSKPKKKGKYGGPKAPQATNSDGTAKNALDINDNVMGGKPIKR
jgi:hypothetical protein